MGKSERQTSGRVEIEMIGGSMKMTSRFAMVAAAGVLLGAAVTSAKAADLGGGCCADLEERVAELEATTARKGNRVVSLQVYGQVNKALLIWDDGRDSDAYIVDNDTSGTRIGFVGSAALKPGWKAGFAVELDIQDSASDKVANGNDEGNDNEIAIRYSNVYIESEKFGRITLGQQSTAADGAAEVVLGNSLVNASVFVGNSFLVGSGRRLSGDSLKNPNDGYANSFDGGRDDVIRYDSPSIYGFILSASWGDNDYYDVALRFKKEWNSIRIAAAAAYQNFEDNNVSNSKNFEVLNGSISVMHIPTGIYGAFAAGEREIDGDDGGSYWYGQLGIEKKFTSYGSTTVYGEYGNYKDILAAADDSEAERWGFGVVQKFDSAALELYAQATFWSFDDASALNKEDFSTIMLGSRIKF
jgi:predicted porin